MKRFVWLFVLLVLFLCGLSLAQTQSNANAAVPRLIKFSGTIPNAQGTVGVLLALYKDQSGGTPLWLESQSVTVDEQGKYVVLLGAEHAEGVPLDLFSSGEARWLGVQPEGQPELPRVLLFSVPYALVAGDAQTLGGKPLSAFVLADSASVSASGTAVKSAYVNTRAVANAVTALATGTTGTAGYLGMFTDSTNLGNSALFQSGGKIGLGTTTPHASLQVLGSAVVGDAESIPPGLTSPSLGQVLIYNSAGSNYTLQTSSNMPAIGPGVLFRRSRGTTASQTGIQAGDQLFGLFGAGYTSSGGYGNNVAVIKAWAAEPFTSTNQGAYLTFESTPTGTITRVERLRVSPNGNVGIGTTTPGQKLTVAGTIQSTSGGFMFPDGSTQTTASGVGGNFVASGYFSLPDTTSSTTGVLNVGARPFLHNYGAYNNTFLGGQSGGGFLATGGQNTATGYQSLYSLTTGINNSAFGYISMYNNTTGYGNSAFGSSSLLNNSTGYANSAFGREALLGNLSGVGNSAFGYEALYYSTTNFNSAFGYQALVSNTTGYNNSAFGSNALRSNTTGYGNTAIGRWAGANNTTGNNNVYLGYNAGPADTTHGALTNTIAIGNYAQPVNSNTMILGGTGANAVNVGIGTSTPAEALSVVGTVESTSGGFKFPDATTQTTAGLSPAASDARYLQLTGGELSDGLTINHPSGAAHSLYALRIISPVSNGIYIDQTATYAAIYARNTNAGRSWGINGIADSDQGTGVSGASSAGYGVAATTTTGDALHATSTGSGLAGNFVGNVSISGTLSKSAGSFKIDHPLDPEHKYLSHSFVESPDMKNVYDGVVVLDNAGEAVVTLPDWFGALNKDFRYQLTSIGRFMPVYIAEKIVNNQFKIAGGMPGAEVSWQVTGIRQDAYANAHRIPVEESKPVKEQGTYLNPIEAAQSPQRRLNYERDQVVSNPVLYSK